MSDLHEMLYTWPLDVQTPKQKVIETWGFHYWLYLGHSKYVLHPKSVKVHQLNISMSQRN